MPTAAAFAQSAAGEQAYQRGLDAFRARDYAAAHRAFDTALGEFPSGHRLLARTRYNLGRTAQKLGRPCEAIQRFRNYLRVASETREPRRVAQAGKAEKRAESDCRRKRGAPDRAAERAQKSTDPPVTLQVEPTPIAERPAAEPSTRLRIAGWVAIGSAIAAVALGAGYQVAALETRSAGEELGVGEQSRRAELQEELDFERRIMWAGYGTGVVLAGAGAALLVWPDAPPVAVVPVATGAGWVWQDTW